MSAIDGRDAAPERPGEGPQRWRAGEARRESWRERCRRSREFPAGRSLRWKLTWVLFKAVLLAWFVWLSCQIWQLGRERTGMLDHSLREIAEQVLGSMPEGLERLP